jgi:hypothetical protein
MLGALVPYSETIARLQADLDGFIALQPRFVEQKPGSATRVRLFRAEIERFKEKRAQDAQEYERIKDIATGKDEIKRLRILRRMLGVDDAEYIAVLEQPPTKKTEPYPASLRNVVF